MSESQSESYFMTLPVPVYFLEPTETNEVLTFTQENNYCFWKDYRTATSTIANLGIALYGVHADLLIIASLLLLVAMVGAVGLTLKRPVVAPHYDVFAQHYVDFQKVVVQIPGNDSILTFYLSFSDFSNLLILFSPINIVGRVFIWK